MQIQELQTPGRKTGRGAGEQFEAGTNRLWKTVILGVVLCAVAASLLVAASRGRKKVAVAAPAQSAVTVGVARVAREDLVRRIVLTAEFHAFEEVDLHAKVAGYLKFISVDVGDLVKKGQLIATLEMPELQQELAQATATVRRSEDEIERAQAELEHAQSVYAAAHAAYTRLAEVMKSNPELVAQQDMDEAESRDKADEAQIATAKAAFSVSRQQLAVAKANEQRLQALFAYSRITAPFAGVITKRYVDNGAMIQAGTASHAQAMPVVRLSQTDLLRLCIMVPESAAPHVHMDSAVQVRVPALNRSFTGTVARFAKSVDFATRTMHTEVDVPNPTREFVPGMYAEISLDLERKVGVIAVPVQALKRDEEKVCVFCVGADNRIEERPVTLGLETPNAAEVLSGLQDNDLVVVGGRGQLHPGQQVVPKVISVESTGGL
jgi:RND family efflux transporter MFP subunit